MNHAEEAVRMGFLKIAGVHVRSITGRTGGPKRYLLDSRGAGTNLPLRELLLSLMCAGLKECYPTAQIVAGVATSGILWGSWLALSENLPYATVLPDGPRASGLRRQVEGDTDGHAVVLVDNWVRSGASLRRAEEAVLAAGGTVLGALTLVVDDQVESQNDGMPVQSVWRLSEILRAAESLGLVTDWQSLLQ